MASRKIKIGLVQMRMSDSPAENLAHALDLARQAAEKGAKIVCLPELFTTRYFAQYGKKSAEWFAESIPGKTTDALAKAARENKIVLVGGSICEKAGGKLYNTSAVFDQAGKMLGKYRKMHIPHDERYWEKDYFDPGNEGFKVFRTDFGNIGVLICYDQWFPEAARINALMGAEIVFYPTAIGTIEGVEQSEGNWQQAWENVMRGHAISNGMFVCGVNRAGKEDRINFWGGSFVCDAFGKTLARAGSGEEVLVSEIGLSQISSVREGWGFFRNRRPDSYSTLTGKR